MRMNPIKDFQLLTGGLNNNDYNNKNNNNNNNNNNNSNNNYLFIHVLLGSLKKLLKQEQHRQKDYLPYWLD